MRDPKNKNAPQENDPEPEDDKLTIDDIREVFEEEKDRSDSVDEDIEDFEIDIL